MRAAQQLALRAADERPADPPTLPEAAVDHGRGRVRRDAAGLVRSPRQPDDAAGARHAALLRRGARIPGRDCNAPTAAREPGRDRTIELPGALAAATARGLVNAAAERAERGRETLAWRVAELDPEVAPGTVVRVPGHGGLWRVAGWEWRERGVELALARLPRGPARASAGGCQPGAAAPDLVATPTLAPRVRAAVGRRRNGTGAAGLRRRVVGDRRVDRRGALCRAGRRTRSAGWQRRPRRSCIGAAAAAGGSVVRDIARARCRAGGRAGLGRLACSPGPASRRWRWAPIARCSAAKCCNSSKRCRSATRAGACAGCCADAAAPKRRRRPDIRPGPHSCCSTTARWRSIPGSCLRRPTRSPAIDLADAEPVSAAIANRGLTLRPLTPVHPRVGQTADGGLVLRWTRRARGAWPWPDGVETPLNEQAEAWLVGLGDVASPAVRWELAQPLLELSAGARTCSPPRTPVRRCGSARPAASRSRRRCC